MLKLRQRLFAIAVGASLAGHAGLAVVFHAKGSVSNLSGDAAVEVIGFDEEPEVKAPRPHRHEARRRERKRVAVTSPVDEGVLPHEEADAETEPASASDAAAPADGRGLVYSEGEVDTPAKLTSSPKLRYPPNELAEGNEAEVEVYLVIDESGRVIEKRVSQSAGREFDQAALDAAQSLVFTPARKRDRPVAVHIHWTCKFRIQ